MVEREKNYAREDLSVLNMASTFQCGFIRSCLLHVNKTIHTGDIHWKYCYFEEQFQKFGITLDEKCFRRKLNDFKNFIYKHAWYGEQKQSYMKMFDRRSWDILPISDKKKHTLNCCVECISKFPESKTLFPQVTGHASSITKYYKYNNNYCYEYISK